MRVTALLPLNHISLGSMTMSIEIPGTDVKRWKPRFDQGSSSKRVSAGPLGRSIWFFPWPGSFFFGPQARSRVVGSDGASPCFVSVFPPPPPPRTKIFPESFLEVNSSLSREDPFVGGLLPTQKPPPPPPPPPPHSTARPLLGLIPPFQIKSRLPSFDASLMGSHRHQFPSQ